LKTKLEPGEDFIKKGVVSYQSWENYGTLVLTDRRLIWDRGLSIAPIGQRHFSVPLSMIRGCRSERNKVILSIDGSPECWLLIWGKWGLFNSGRRTRDWWQAIVDARFEGAKHEEPD
jgi:hypothetical protein